MITKITGVLNRVLDEEARLQVGDLEYQVLVPEFIRRRIQSQVDQELTFYTIHYFEGNPMQGRVMPRLIGFLHESEIEFFELFCTVDKVGIRKAIKALAQPIKDIANAIQREDAKWLTSLPGIGAASAEQIVAKLKRKMTRFALTSPEQASEPGAAEIDSQLFEDAYQALLTLGHGPLDARERLQKVLGDGREFESVEEVISEIYRQGK